MMTVRRATLIAWGALLLVLLGAGSARAETVVKTKRLGNNTEGMTYVPDGHWKGHAVAIDGNDVIAIRLTPHSHGNGDPKGGPARTIFDVLPLGPTALVPRGIVYVPGLRQFYFSTTQTTSLFRTDETGVPQPTLTLTFPPSIDLSNFAQYEGMTWIPADAPEHPNTIAALVITPSYETRLWYIRLDGTVEAEVVPTPGSPLDDYITGIAYLPQSPGTLLVSIGEYAYEMDLDGNFLGGPVLAVAGASDLESLIADDQGSVFAADYPSGRLIAFDSSLARQAGEDRDFVVGVGVSVRTIAWDADTREFLISELNFGGGRYQVAAVPLDLKSARIAATLDPSRGTGPAGIAYLGNGQLAFTYRFYPRGLAIINLADSSEVSRLVFEGTPDFPPGVAFRPIGVSAAGSSELAIRVAGDANAMKFVSRAGTADNTYVANGQIPARFPDLPLAAPTNGRDAQLFDDGTGVKIFTDREIYDATGNLLHTVDVSALGLPGGVFSGTWVEGDTYAVADYGTSTIVIFTIP